MLSFEIHDDDWQDLDKFGIPDSAQQHLTSHISINWTRVEIHDPFWEMYIRLLGQSRWPWIIED